MTLFLFYYFLNDRETEMKRKNEWFWSYRRLLRISCFHEIPWNHDMKTNKWIIGLINLFLRHKLLCSNYYILSLLFWEIYNSWKSGKKMSSSKVKIIVIRTSLKDQVDVHEENISMWLLISLMSPNHQKGTSHLAKKHWAAFRRHNKMTKHLLFVLWIITMRIQIWTLIWTGKDMRWDFL